MGALCQELNAVQLLEPVKEDLPKLESTRRRFISGSVTPAISHSAPLRGRESEAR